MAGTGMLQVEYHYLAARMKQLNFVASLDGNENNNWTNTTNTSVTWGATITSLYQSRVFGINEGRGILGKIPGNQGWWTQPNGTYRSVSSASRAGSEELSALKT